VLARRTSSITCGNGTVVSNQLTMMPVISWEDAPLFVRTMLSVFESDVPRLPAEIWQPGVEVNGGVLVLSRVWVGVKVVVAVFVNDGVREMARVLEAVFV